MSAAAVRTPVSLAEIDGALARLRVLARSGPVVERELARLAIDDLLERRFKVMRKETH